MGSLKLFLPDELEKEFRLYIAVSMGMKKGNIGKACQEAVILWVDKKKVDLKGTDAAELIARFSKIPGAIS